MMFINYYAIICKISLFLNIYCTLHILVILSLCFESIYSTHIIHYIPIVYSASPVQIIRV